jgi:Zn-dependent protease
VAVVTIAAVLLALGAIVRIGLLLVAPAGLVLFLGSFLAHEGAHAGVAHWHGLHVDNITLRLGGGMTSYTGTAPGPGPRIQIATAGPLASALLATVFAAAALALGNTSASGFFEVFAGVNLFLTAINLLPAPRLDGGQIVAAVGQARRERAEARRIRSTGAT